MSAKPNPSGRGRQFPADQCRRSPSIVPPSRAGPQAYRQSSDLVGRDQKSTFRCLPGASVSRSNPRKASRGKPLNGDAPMLPRSMYPVILILPGCPHPRTECCCQPVAAMMPAIVVPVRSCSIATTCAFLVPARVFPLPSSARPLAAGDSYTRRGRCRRYRRIGGYRVFRQEMAEAQLIDGNRASL